MAGAIMKGLGSLGRGAYQAMKRGANSSIVEDGLLESMGSFGRRIDQKMDPGAYPYAGPEQRSDASIAQRAAVGQPRTIEQVSAELQSLRQEYTQLMNQPTGTIDRSVVPKIQSRMKELSEEMIRLQEGAPPVVRPSATPQQKQTMPQVSQSMMDDIMVRSQPSAPMRQSQPQRPQVQPERRSQQRPK